jgi:hypothetical protein
MVRLCRFGGRHRQPDLCQHDPGGRARGGDPNSPREVINSAYYKPPFRHHREEDILTSLLSTRTGEDFYPGDSTPSGNWPFVAPGTRGSANAFAPKYCNLAALVDIDPKPPVLWIQAADDLIVSDHSLFEFGTLGQLGIVPGWPGLDAYPPQPMVSQTRHVPGAVQNQWRSVQRAPHLRLRARRLPQSS